jgi:hypothetical protein
MPKKFKGENSKAVEARARKAAKKNEEEERKQAQLEEEFWRDDDKHVQRKAQRKEDREKKRVEALERKQEKQKLLEEEMAGMKSAKASAPKKLTRAEIEAERERMAAIAAAEKKQQETPVNELPLEENVNRMEAEGEARTVEEALSILSVKEPAMDRHPEKRMKAAYQAFEDENLPRLKAENPNMRLSQIKQMLKKDWMKSPQNPMNQRHVSYNAK